MTIPAVLAAKVFGPPRKQLALHFWPGSEMCPHPAESGSAHPPSETLQADGPSDPGLKVNR